jgi:UDP-N-acetylglucosamine transferase subunit ALG13
VIFVTVGTHLPFDRLVRSLDDCAVDERLVVQVGAGGARPRAAEIVGFLPFDELIAHIRAARVVVCHAGVGSVLSCLQNGKRPIVVPRRAAHAEAVDDHQVEFARRLGAAGLVTLVEEPSGLSDALAAASPELELGATGGRLARELGAYVRDVVGGRR